MALLRSISRARGNRGMKVVLQRWRNNSRFQRLGGPEAPSVPLLGFSLQRKVQVLKPGSRTGSASDRTAVTAAKPTGGDALSGSLLGKFRDRFETMMTKAASKGGDSSAIPVAKASRAPFTLAKIFDSWNWVSGLRFRRGPKVRSLDPGFKMTRAEEEYMEHLKAIAIAGRI